ncbi:MAG: polymer-forming cytoskeletal protein [Methanobacteriota archaeon]
MIVADRSRLEYGLETKGRIFLGEGVEVAGGLSAGGDVRADLFSRIQGDVTSGGSAYLGERSRVEGSLRVEKDLDVGDDVTLEKGFEARGWINIRNPIPLVVYIFLYLLQLTGQGKGEEVEKILAKLEEDDPQAEILVGEGFLFVPQQSVLGLQESSVPGNLDVGGQCRVLGNFSAQGFVTIGEGSEFHGSVRATGDVRVGPHVVVDGDIRCGGTLRIEADARVHGAIHAGAVEMMQTATVEGTVQAARGVRFLTPEYLEMRQKLDDFKSGRLEVRELLP